MRSLTLLALALSACGEPPPPAPFPVTFEASSDPGVPLAGVTITAAGQPVGTTGEHGTLTAELRGPVGSLVAVGATCPAGHREPLPVPAVVLRPAIDLATGAPATMRVSVTCPPALRHGVLVVRATGAGSREGIPVLVDGLEVARTDRSGVAHVALERPPGTTVNVMLATATVMPDLLPRDPVLPVSFADRDDIFYFDRPFETPAPPPVIRRGGGHRREPEPEERREGPTCLSCR